MTTLEILPFILFIVVIVTAVAERINVPYPLLLVIAGLVVGFVPGMPVWHPTGDTVLDLFLPPILFSAARLISWRDIRNNISTIISLSFILVILSALFIAFVLNYFIPQMTFSTALVLGAIIAPTDTVAATAILHNMNVREHLIRTIKVESLFNDAIGIVLYKAALVMVFLGTMNLTNLTGHTIMIGFGGIAVGLVFAFLTGIIVEQFLTHSENELPIVMSLILAYVAYLFAEHIGVSSIIAVVAAGLFHKKTERAIEAKTRLSETTVWNTLIFFLNGIIFITIGIQFPTYLSKVSYLSTTELILFSLMTIVALLFLRLIWVTLTHAITIGYARFKHRHAPHNRIQIAWSNIIIVSWSGMRGLVSLALAIAIPVSFANEQIFPYRDLIIFLTMITILFTLVVQGLTLPLIIKWLRAGKDNINEMVEIEAIYDQLTRKALETIRDLNERKHDYSQATIKLVENYYANRMLHMTLPNEVEMENHLVRMQAEELLSHILKIERSILDRMRKQGEVSEEVYIKIVRKMDHDEVGFASYG